MKILTLLCLIIVLSFPMNADNICGSDTLEIDYDNLYAVHWNVNVYPVANIYTFPQNDVDRIVGVLSDSQKEVLFQGSIMLSYYLDVTLDEAEQIKSNLMSVELPIGFDWKFGLFQNEQQELAMFAAVVDSKSPFNFQVGHACFEKDPFGKPAIAFSLRQGESDDIANEYRKYCLKHKHNGVILSINDRSFTPTQMKQLNIPSNEVVTVSYVPYVVIQDLYSSHVRYMLENAMPNEAVRPTTMQSVRNSKKGGKR